MVKKAKDKINSTPSLLTLGSLFFHWSPEKRRDFYFRIADEADIDVVYLGEAVCSKREPFFTPFRDEVLHRLESAGKQVVVTTLALVTLRREMDAIGELSASGRLLEANDVSCLQALDGKPFVVGQFINVFNESTMNFVASKGAVRVVLPVELTTAATWILARHATSLGMTTEVQVFGRQPLSVSMRCYHARAKGRHKENCMFACGEDPDGMTVETIDNKPILAVSGTQTLSYGYCALVGETPSLQAAGVTHFRLSPQDVDMVKVADVYRSVINGSVESIEAMTKLSHLCPDVYFINGYAHGVEGMSWVV